MEAMYYRGNRGLQDEFGSRALADHLSERLARDAFTDSDAAFIARRGFLFLATADAEGRPDCSFKGGDPGFARVVAPDLLVFPDYDGNGMFKASATSGRTRMSGCSSSRWRRRTSARVGCG